MCDNISGKDITKQISTAYCEQCWSFFLFLLRLYIPVDENYSFYHCVFLGHSFREEEFLALCSMFWTASNRSHSPCLYTVHFNEFCTANQLVASVDLLCKKTRYKFFVDWLTGFSSMWGVGWNFASNWPTLLTLCEL